MNKEWPNKTIRKNLEFSISIRNIFHDYIKVLRHYKGTVKVRIVSTQMILTTVSGFFDKI